MAQGIKISVSFDFHGLILLKTDMTIRGWIREREVRGMTMFSLCVRIFIIFVWLN